MILTGNEITKRVNDRSIIIDPFNEEHVGPNSYDATLGNDISCFVIPEKTVIDVRRGGVLHEEDWRLLQSGHEARKIDRNLVLKDSIEERGYLIRPGFFYLSHTAESVGSDKYATMINGRSSIARYGVSVHQTGGFGDLGYKFQWTLEFTCVVPFMLYPGMKIAQFHFHSVEGERGIQYDKRKSSKYTGSTGVVESRLPQEF